VNRQARLLAPAVAAVALVSSFALLHAQQEETSFRVDVSLVNVLATVEDAQGKPIGDLEQSDFTVTDGGVVRPVAIFERRTDRPLSVAIMIDASLSTAIELEQERISAQTFIENLLLKGAHQSDRVAILKFSSYVDLLADFSRSIRTLGRALRSVHAESGTSMYDAVLLASDQLAGREGRRVMIIITDGGDTTSSTSFQQAMRAAHAADAVIYGLIVMPIKSDAGRNTGGENALKAMANNTGGITFTQLSGEQLDEAFDQILRSLRTQYLLGYYPPQLVDSIETFRPISVNVNRADVTVLARKGYFLPDVQRAPGAPRGRISIRPKIKERSSAGEPAAETGAAKRQP
jgi:Ca-activated chloride channel family protein